MAATDPQWDEVLTHALAFVIAEARGERTDLAPPVPLTPVQQQLVLDNIKLALHIAKRYHHFLGEDEAISTAYWGLIKAAQLWDPARGIPFGKFAPMRIEGHLQNEVKSDERRTRLGRMISYGKVKRIADRLTIGPEGRPLTTTLPISPHATNPDIGGEGDVWDVVKESSWGVKPGQRVKARTLGAKPQIVDMKVSTTGTYGIVAGPVLSGPLVGRVVRARVLSREDLRTIQGVTT